MSADIDYNKLRYVLSKYGINDDKEVKEENVSKIVKFLECKSIYEVNAKFNEWSLYNIDDVMLNTSKYAELSNGGYKWNLSLLYHDVDNGYVKIKRSLENIVLVKINRTIMTYLRNFLAITPLDYTAFVTSIGNNNIRILIDEMSSQSTHMHHPNNKYDYDYHFDADRTLVFNGYFRQLFTFSREYFDFKIPIKHIDSITLKFYGANGLIDVPFIFSCNVQYSNPLRLNIINNQLIVEFVDPAIAVISQYTTANPAADVDIIKTINNPNGLPILSVNKSYITINIDGTKLPNKLSNLIVKFCLLQNTALIPLTFYTLK